MAGGCVAQALECCAMTDCSRATGQSSYGQAEAPHASSSAAAVRAGPEPVPSGLRSFGELRFDRFLRTCLPRQAALFMSRDGAPRSFRSKNQERPARCSIEPRRICRAIGSHRSSWACSPLAIGDMALNSVRRNARRLLPTLVGGPAILGKAPGSTQTVSVLAIPVRAGPTPAVWAADFPLGMAGASPQESRQDACLWVPLAPICVAQHSRAAVWQFQTGLCLVRPGSVLVARRSARSEVAPDSLRGRLPLGSRTCSADAGSPRWDA